MKKIDGCHGCMKLESEHTDCRKREYTFIIQYVLYTAFILIKKAALLPVRCAGEPTDRRARRRAPDAVPLGAAHDPQGHPRAGGRRAVPPAALRRTHRPAQPGQHDSEAEAAPRRRASHARVRSLAL